MIRGFNGTGKTVAQRTKGAKEPEGSEIIRWVQEK